MNKSTVTQVYWEVVVFLTVHVGVGGGDVIFIYVPL